MINCIIIEDEPLAQKGLRNLIKEVNNLNLLHVCDDIEEFITFQKTNKISIDLLFLDIELPKKNGIDFLKEKKLNIPVVITTAYHNYAIDAFELDVLDYLLKPISLARFKQTMLKVEDYIDYQNTKHAKNEKTYIYIKTDRTFEKIYFNDLIYIEAMGNYVIYHTETHKFICYSSLKTIVTMLPQEIFIKIHKSYIVNIQKIEKIDKGVVFINDKQITINRENKNDIIALVTKNFKS